MVRPSLRTRSVGASLTAEEYAALERQAEASGQSLSEWCREVMLASVNGQAPKNQQSFALEMQAVMAELVALRTARQMSQGLRRRPMIRDSESRR